MTRAARTFLICIVIIIGLTFCCFIFRGYLLQVAFAKAQSRVHDHYHATLSASSVRFTGLTKVALKNITLQPDNADTFMRVSEAEVDISITNLFRAKIAADHIRVVGVSFTVYNEEDRNNVRFLIPTPHEKSGDGTMSTGFKDRAVNWENKLFQLLNTAFDTKDIRFYYKDNAYTESLYIPTFSYDLHKLTGLLINDGKVDTIKISGRVLSKGKSYQCFIQHSGSDSAYLPFLNHDRGLKCRFKDISATINFDDAVDGNKISTDATITDFHINHWRLANDDVILPEAKFKGLFTFTDYAMEMDSSSVMTIYKVHSHVFARYGLQPDTTFALSLRMPETESDTFFQSLPLGMFNTLKGISCSGTLTYDLLFALHTNNPDSLIFTSSLKQKNLHILSYGEENYNRINAPFIYDAYDKDRLVRRIMVGPDNPYFTPLSQMSAYLPQSVLQAEDPSFMQHRGFLSDAFRESIAKNYKEKRFARGGSTISMQLVKNVFLSRDKTISRKAEEGLIVYLIENLGLVSKERMLEVYLNVIEWGPNVYGIGEAAHFYFNKKPAKLSLQESLFLASIIPRPKFFQYEFTAGQLRPSMSSYFKILTARMVWRGVLDPQDTIGLEPKVTLRGAALHVVAPGDSIPDDGEDIGQ